jgi:HTH-type transcriptional regulator/antitoxin HigA
MMTIKSEQEFRTYQAEMEAITQRGFELGDMELLSDEDKERYIQLSGAIHEWEAAYHPLPGRESSLHTDDTPSKRECVYVPVVEAARHTASYAF